MSTEKTAASAWQRFTRMSCFTEAGVDLDLADMGFSADQLTALSERLGQALGAMRELESGAIANPDEGRQVGHYWLRAPELAPNAEQKNAIVDAVAQVEGLRDAVHAGELAGERGPFQEVLVVGIGGSSLGPKLVCDALARSSDRMRVRFLDNTDPDGIDRLIDATDDLGRCLVIVISKSGGTKETRNGMLEVARAYADDGLAFGKHAMAITQDGSKLDAYARDQGFMARIPMWDWVGGRTSVTSAVGLLPAALQGRDVRALLAGAAKMDRATRHEVSTQNPAALLAAAWLLSGDPRPRNMVVLPYKDRLELLTRYLQQLVMESVGKREDRDGKRVDQGITVYGNKGSTDQHAYVQQLRDGPDDFFVTFVEVLEDRPAERPSIEVEPGFTSGDYLAGFMIGTRRALAERGRQSLTITLRAVDEERLGALIALFERAVGLYAELVNVNAYHQPGVEAGKRAAGVALELQARVLRHLQSAGPEGLDAPTVAQQLGEADVLTVHRLLRRLAAAGRVHRQAAVSVEEPDTSSYAARYTARP
jgi:glucose-6-phosphate isomerase